MVAVWFPSTNVELAVVLNLAWGHVLQRSPRSSSYKFLAKVEIWQLNVLVISKVVLPVSKTTWLKICGLEKYLLGGRTNTHGKYLRRSPHWTRRRHMREELQIFLETLLTSDVTKPSKGMSVSKWTAGQVAEFIELTGGLSLKRNHPKARWLVPMPYAWGENLSERCATGGQWYKE